MRSAESEEVGDAVGAAIVTNKQLLAEKQSALEEAKGRYQIAKEYRAEEDMGVEVGKMDALRAIISEIEMELFGEREVVGVRQAKARLLGIKRAAGSVVTSIDIDEHRVIESAAAVTEAIATLNNRYSQMVQLRAEAAALADRFNLPKPSLPVVEAPARRAVAGALTTLPNTLLATAWPNQATEQCEFNMRSRRTYTECAADSDGYKIIVAAGLRAWPELTEHQSDIIAARAREKESMRRTLSGLPKIPATGNVPLGTL